jgi:hypothetical protein
VVHSQGRRCSSRGVSGLRDVEVAAPAPALVSGCFAGPIGPAHLRAIKHVDR